MNEKTFINPEGGWQPNKKIEFDLKELCKGFPNELINYIEYCR